MRRPFIWYRGTELWIGSLGVFWSRDIRGIELPSGHWIGLP